MIIDGRKIAEKIKEKLKEEISKSDMKLKIAIIQVGYDIASSKFIEKKERFAEEVGVRARIYKFPIDISTNKLRKKIAEITHPQAGKKQNFGVIIQLPLPSHINTQYILDSVPLNNDVDMLSSKSTGEFSVGKSNILPPVVGVVKNILSLSGSTSKLSGKNIVVVGEGLLVGKPVATWLINEGATVSVLNKETHNISNFTKEAESDIGSLDIKVRARVLEKIGWLRDNFETVNHLPLGYGWQGFFKLRVGDWQVIYKIHGRTITILRIGHRREIYGR